MRLVILAELKVYYDEIANILGVAKGTVFNYIRKFRIRKIFE